MGVLNNKTKYKELRQKYRAYKNVPDDDIPKLEAIREMLKRMKDY